MDEIFKTEKIVRYILGGIQAGRGAGAPPIIVSEGVASSYSPTYRYL